MGKVWTSAQTGGLSVGARIKHWVTAPVFKDDAEKTNLARIVYLFVLGLLGAIFVYLLSVVITAEPVSPLVALVMVVLGVSFLAALFLVRAGRVFLAGVIIVLVLWITCSALILSFGGIHDETVAGYYLVILMSGFVLGGRGLVAVTGLSTLVLTAAFVLERTGVLDPSGILPSEPRSLLIVLLALITGGLFQRYAVRRLARATEAARESAKQMEAAKAALKASEAELATESGRLQRRLSASMAVTREAAASSGNVDLLLSRTVRVISTEFGFYHAAVYWVDPSGEWLVLQAASSEAGQRMLARGYRVPMGSGVVGAVASRGVARTASDVDRDARALLPQDLHQTKSEMAVPLRLVQGSSETEHIIGVLDVQSAEPGGFGEDDVMVLQALADQLSLAVANARLLAEAQESVAAAQRAYGEMTAAAWQKLLRQSGGLSFASGTHGTFSQAVARDGMVQAGPTGAMASADGGYGTLGIPIRVGGQPIGVVEVHLPSEMGQPGQSPWTQERIDVLEQLSVQLSQAVERARLYQETQNSALLEQMIGEVTSRVRSEVEIEMVLERALSELGQALGAERGSAFLTLASEGLSSDGGEDGHE